MQLFTAEFQAFSIQFVATIWTLLASNMRKCHCLIIPFRSALLIVLHTLASTYVRTSAYFFWIICICMLPCLQQQRNRLANYWNIFFCGSLFLPYMVFFCLHFIFDLLWLSYSTQMRPVLHFVYLQHFYVFCVAMQHLRVMLWL